ncbi:MAG: endonuclease [Muribaculaceae bacterium]|nr:endonuclease [Muribaculaceae bacterium]
MKKLIISLFTLWIAAFSGSAAAPAGYYKSCEGKTGKQLLSALYNVIGSHTTVSYDGLWEVFKTSDVRDNGTVWDMYSTKEWVVGQQKCGNYKLVGDCINREHSFPKSWFNDARPMYSDAFHLYPTDGKVNGQRSNYPYGECSGGTTLPANGSVKALGKLGKSTFAGYSSTVFEPVDEYKGDFARSYFYMAACYYDKIAGWNSDMLAHNNYPAFSSWALNLLLKWHRQDPVSKKETDRNDAVYAHQHNRNPFIDYPELVEYIWGNKNGTDWTPGGQIEAILSSPYDGASYDIGITGIGVERSVNIPLKGTGLTSPVSATISGKGFTLSSNSVAADLVNNGRGSIVVYYSSSTAGKASATLTLTSGSIKHTVTITAEAVAGLPLQLPTDISETSFMARWTNVDGDGATYLLGLFLNGEPVAGYPMKVPAEDEEFLVENLEPATTYTYNISNGTLTSETRTVTTTSPLSSIQFLFDGELELSAVAGEAGEIAEILLDVDNISDDIILTVTPPFDLSTDKSGWSQHLTLTPDEDRFYLRLHGDQPGTYMTTILAEAGDYVNDDVIVSGTIRSASSSFLEDFESGNWKGSYSAGTYEGSAAIWNMTDAGVYENDNKMAYEGAGVCRMGKTASSTLALSSPKEGGIGTVTFQARPWTGDGEAVIAVEWSADGDAWSTAGNVTVSGDSYTEQSVSVNHAGNLYLRLRQTSGKRILIDNISATDCSAVGAVDELYYHSWDAFARDGQLIIENRGAEPAEFSVYGIDGISRLDAVSLPAGETVLELPKGLYIVVSGDFARRVVVK